MQPLSRNPNEQHEVDFSNYFIPFFSSVIGLQRKLVGYSEKTVCSAHAHKYTYIKYNIGSKECIYTWCLGKYDIVR